MSQEGREVLEVEEEPASLSPVPPRCDRRRPSVPPGREEQGDGWEQGYTWPLAPAHLSMG